ncbi:MAG: di-heme oxidoredictase family protein [Hyphomicrobium sp.]
MTAKAAALAAVALSVLFAATLSDTFADADAGESEQPSAATAPSVHSATDATPDARPGGDATSKASVDTANAFSASSANLSFEKELDFKIGNAIFRKFWVSAPASTKTSDGLGPLYNARSCQGCHLKDGRGHPPSEAAPDEDAASMFLRLSVPPQTDEDRKRLADHRSNVIPDPVYGGQLQNFAVQGHAIEGRMRVRYEPLPMTFADGTVVTLRKPTYDITDLGYGALHPQIMLSPRVAPPMIGLGLLEAVPDTAILARADPDDRDGDGISGRENRVWSLADNAVAVGRFGWKAGNPSVRQQSAEAFAGDIGISSSLVPKPAGECTDAQTLCRAAPTGAPSLTPNVEISDDLMKLVTFYAGNLAVPPRRAASAPDVVAGQALFSDIGCAKCHQPSFKTGKSTDNPHLSDQTIWPYTDLLLHDMGEGLADQRPEGVADGREWRTPPLWGIGLTQTVSGHTFLLHDGRARGIVEAILWHAGEAEKVRKAFMDLPKAERDALVAFVNSL